MGVPVQREQSLTVRLSGGSGTTRYYARFSEKHNEPCPRDGTPRRSGRCGNGRRLQPDCSRWVRQQYKDTISARKFKEISAGGNLHPADGCRFSLKDEM